MAAVLSCAPVKRTAHPLAWPARAKHDGTEVLALSLAQIPSQTDVVVGLTVKNKSPKAIQLVENPQFSEYPDRGGRESEFEFVAVDLHQRRVPYLCSDMKGFLLRKFRILESGKAITFQFVFSRFCYDLIPGEQLRFFATFVNADVGGLEPAELAKTAEVDPSGWLSLTVPSGWVRE